MHRPNEQRLRISSPAGLLAVVPHLLGFTPESSLVVLGVAPPAGRIKFGLRYDLPDPPDTAAAAAIAAHAAGILGRYQLTTATVAGYGPGPLVTPVADAIRAHGVPRRGGAAGRAARAGRPVLVLPVQRAVVLPGRGHAVRPGQAPRQRGPG